MSGAWVAIGRVRTVRPGHRQLRIEPLPGLETQFAAIRQIGFRRGGQEPALHGVVTVEVQTRYAVVTLGSGVSADAVAALRGADVVIAQADMKAPEAALPPAPAMQDFDVMDVSGKRLGRVTATYFSRGNSVIEIEEDGGGTALLPVSRTTIERVDMERGAVIVFDMDPFRQEA